MEVLDGPLTVGWDITHMCNLRCKHCYAAAGKIGNNEFTLDEVKKIVDELDKLGTMLIALAGGEPLMRNYCLYKKQRNGSFFKYKWYINN